MSRIPPRARFRLWALLGGAAGLYACLHLPDTDAGPLAFPVLGLAAGAAAGSLLDSLLSRFLDR